MMRSVVAVEQPQVVLETDASGTWGCGAVWAARWFQLSWEKLQLPGSQRHASIYGRGDHLSKERPSSHLLPAIWRLYWSSRGNPHCGQL